MVMMMTVLILRGVLEPDFGLSKSADVWGG
jgi:hypothetical protein